MRNVELVGWSEKKDYMDVKDGKYFTGAMKEWKFGPVLKRRSSPQGEEKEVRLHKAGNRYH